jgi:hypothetical protein
MKQEKPGTKSLRLKVFPMSVGQPYTHAMKRRRGIENE